MWRAVPGGAVRTPGHLPSPHTCPPGRTHLPTCASRKDTGTVCGTVQAERIPALPAGHRDGVAGGARGCWVGTVWRAVPGGLGLRLVGWRAGSWGMACPPSCARMSELLLQPPGSSPHRTRDGCPQGRSPAPALPAGHRDGVRCAAHLHWRAAPGGAGVAKLGAVGRPLSYSRRGHSWRYPSQHLCKKAEPG